MLVTYPAYPVSVECRESVIFISGARAILPQVGGGWWT